MVYKTTIFSLLHLLNLEISVLPPNNIKQELKRLTTFDSVFISGYQRQITVISLTALSQITPADKVILNVYIPNNIFIYMYFYTIQYPAYQYLSVTGKLSDSDS